MIMVTCFFGSFVHGLGLFSTTHFLNIRLVLSVLKTVLVVACILTQFSFVGDLYLVTTLCTWMWE